jgi:O-antigen ligase
MALFKKSTNIKKIGLVALTIIVSFTASYLLINYTSKLPIDISKTFGKKGGAAFTQQLTTTGFEGGGDERAKSREKALKILNENKSAYVLGIGPGQYGVYVTNNRQEYYGWPIVNNLTLELLVETGIIGLGLVVLFFVRLMWEGFVAIGSKAKTIPLDSVVVLGIISYFASQALQFQTFSTLYVMQVWVAVGLALGILRVSKVKKLP